MHELNNPDPRCREDLHSEGARIRKLLEITKSLLWRFYELKIYLYQNKNPELLEACFQHAFVKKYNCSPLFNKKLECVDDTCNPSLDELVSELRRLNGN